MPEPLLLENLGWPDVAAYLEKDDRIILPTGSCEQHGRHLVFGTDALVPYAIAQRVSQRTGVLVAPPLNYGMSLHHLVFPGSIALRPETLAHAAEDILRSLYQHGFRRVLILNGHGGNIAALQCAVQLLGHELPDLQVRLRQWWREPEVQAILQEAFPGQRGGHAAQGETSVVLALRPEVVRLERARHSPEAPRPGVLTGATFQRYYPHGVIGGDPRQARAEVGERVLETAVSVYARLLEEEWP